MSTTVARRPASTSILVLAASILAFAVIAARHHAPVRTESRVAQVSIDLPDRTSYSSSDQDLLKARIGFARRIGL